MENASFVIFPFKEDGRKMVCTDKKSVGIKYCGGCNPNYERVKMVQRVQSLMSDRFLFRRHDQQDLDLLVLMNGCPRACAEKDLTQTEIPCRSIIEEIEFESLIDWLTALNGGANI
jgi:hypothetical protein